MVRFIKYVNEGEDSTTLEITRDNEFIHFYISDIHNFDMQTASLSIESVKRFITDLQYLVEHE
jgi:hypothetical protein